MIQSSTLITDHNILSKSGLNYSKHFKINFADMGISFEDLLSYFPEVELPVILSEESPHTFDRHNTPFPAHIIEAFLVQIDPGTIDEFTEYVPCFRLPDQADFHALIYWKAGLLDYQFHLVTYDKKTLKLIDHSTLAGVQSINNKLSRSVATIDEDLIIHVVKGESTGEESPYDASSTISYHYELLPGGQIISSLS